MQIRPMREDDLDEVMEIERRSFSLPWPRKAYLSEMRKVDTSRLLVAAGEAPRSGAPGARIMGYACWWAVADECQIATFAVAPACRRRGVGSALLGRILQDAGECGIVRATLGVRVSNAAAIALYEKWGFTAAAMRPRYYSDNREDALVMWKERI